MNDFEASMLAIIMGISFGTLAHWLWRWSASKTAAVLLLLYFMQTFAQGLLRIFDGIGTTDELVTIATLRLEFGIAACLAAGLLDRVRE